jgi:hypothetical protein
VGATKPIATYPWFKWTVDLSTTDNTVTPYVYRVLTTWVEGTVEAMLQGTGAIEDKFYACLSHSNAFDQVLECDRSGAWYLRKYGSSQNPSMMFEFKGKGYVLNGKYFSSEAEASLYTFDTGGALALLALTKAYSLDTLLEKEVDGMWITYRHKAGSIENPVGCLMIYYNLDDEFDLQTGNMLIDLSRHQLGGGGWTLVSDGSLALTTQFIAFPFLNADTKGRRVSLIFSGQYGVEAEIHDWGFASRKIPMDRGSDPRAELEVEPPT